MVARMVEQAMLKGLRGFSTHIPDHERQDLRENGNFLFGDVDPIGVLQSSEKVFRNNFGTIRAEQQGKPGNTP